MTLLTRLVAWACLLTWASALLHYRIEDQAPAPIDTIQQLNARSRILCGIFCFRRRCQAFTFVGKRRRALLSEESSLLFRFQGEL